MNHADTRLSEEESRWIANLSGRLQMIRADAAISTTVQRQEYFHEEIERGLKTVPTGDRKRLLGALLARFPVAGKTVDAVQPEKPAIVPIPKAETAEETLNRLLASLDKLPADQKTQLSKILFASSLARDRSEQPVLEINEKMQKALGLAVHEQPIFERLVQVVAQFMDMFAALDHTALKTLGQLAPRSSVRPEDMRKATARFLTGQSDSLDAQIQGHMRLLGAFLAATLSASRDFEREHIERFSPERIADVIEGEGGGTFMGPNKKERCWKKYEDLSRDYLKPGFIERQIKDWLGAAVERVARPPR